MPVYRAPRARWRNNLLPQINAKIWAKIKWNALITALTLVFPKIPYKKRNLIWRLAINCQKVPNHYCFEENFKLLKRSKTIHFLLIESNFFEFGTSWMVWIFWAHVSKAFKCHYQILVNRCQQLPFWFCLKIMFLKVCFEETLFTQFWLFRSKKLFSL